MRWLAVLALVGCGDNRALPTREGTRTFLTPTQHLARASLALRGVRPSPDELRAVAADPDQLSPLIDGYLHAPEFGDTVRAVHDEALLLRIRDQGYTLPPYPPLDVYTFDQINDSIYDEPLRLIEDVVTTDQPYTRIVTADYTMADGIVGSAWGLDREPGPGWQRAKGRPAAGVLASPAIYMRYRSAATNYNRGRANAISRGLLCHDFLAADISIDTSVDLSNPAVVANAVVANPSCAGCHQTLDPLASYFFPFAQGPLPVSHIGYPYAGFYTPDNAIGWFLTNDRPPAYFGQQADGLEGLGRAIAADPRFARCAVVHFASYLTESQTLDDAWLAQLQTRFEHGYNARELVRDIVFSDAFRVDDDDDETAAQGLVGLQKVRPAQLATMVQAITGFEWTDYSRDPIGTSVPQWREGLYHVLDDDVAGYRVLAGGKDDFLVTENVNTMTPSSTLVVRQLAFQAATYLVAHDARYADATDVHAKLVDLKARIYSELTDDVSDEEQLFGSIDDPKRAWTVVITAMLSDQRAVYY